MISPLLAALDLLPFGAWVFPVAADDCRRPLIERGCYAASNDPAVVKAWARQHSRANVAIACGERSGVWVLDVDAKGERDGYLDLEELQARYGDIPRTWTSSTPSGGQHLYFKRPGPAYTWRERPDERRLTNSAPLRIDGVKSGLDVRDQGASAALPPSRKGSGSYRWTVSPWDSAPAEAPRWLLDIVDPLPPPPRPPAPPLRMDDTGKTARYVEAVVNGECGELASMGRASGRNQRLFRAAANLGSLCGAGLLPDGMAESALEQAAAECGLTAEDGRRSVEKTIASGMKRGLANPREMRA